MSPHLRAFALLALQINDPYEKCRIVKQTAATALAPDFASLYPEPNHLPGRPERPELIHPAEVKHRSMLTIEGRAALVHALAHIELNAVNLALDIVWRFPALPETFYTDWLGVAQEEALHFTLLSDHLRTLGFKYGDFPAHNGLWEMAEKTKTDLLARLALVPRTLEARGLDVSPLLRNKLKQAGDLPAAAILEVILRDEIGHVAIGNRWYRWLCAQRDLDPLQTFSDMAQRYRAPLQRGPFNLEARRAAGFDEAELKALCEAAAQNDMQRHASK